MGTRRQFFKWAAGAAAVPASLSGYAQGADVGDAGADVSMMKALDALKYAETLRRAGLLIYERRCWGVYRQIDGRQYGYGCGSYFRWLFPTTSICPFCRLAWPNGEANGMEALSAFPLTINFTGDRGKLNEFEEPICNRLPNDRWRDS